MSFVITTSWDDGHRLDLRLAERLHRYGLTGSFYIARDFLDARMTVSELRELSQSHELGAHTLSHPILTEIPLEQAKQEIEGSKKWLEDVLGKEVTAFCYPRGKHNAALQALVKAAGFKMARSVESYHLTLGDNLFAVPTSLQIYPYPVRPLPNIPLYKGWKTRLSPLLEAWQHRQDIPISSFRSWEAYALAWLKKAADTGGIWHLWGHSWEIEDYQLWEALDSLLKAASQVKGYQAKSNSELVHP